MNVLIKNFLIITVFSILLTYSVEPPIQGVGIAPEVGVVENTPVDLTHTDEYEDEEVLPPRGGGGGSSHHEEEE